MCSYHHEHHGSMRALWVEKPNSGCVKGSMQRFVHSYFILFIFRGFLFMYAYCTTVFQLLQFVCLSLSKLFRHFIAVYITSYKAPDSNIDLLF